MTLGPARTARVRRWECLKQCYHALKLCWSRVELGRASRLAQPREEGEAPNVVRCVALLVVQVHLVDRAALSQVDLRVAC